MDPILKVAQGVESWLIEDLCLAQWWLQFGTMPSQELLRECAYLVKKNWVKKLEELVAVRPYMSQACAVGELHIEVARLVRCSNAAHV